VEVELRVEKAGSGKRKGKAGKVRESLNLNFV